MHNTEERAALVDARVRALFRRRERWEMMGLSALSGGLLMALLALIGRLSGTGHPLPFGELTGASLLSDSAGGYVLVAVLSFAAAVSLTTLCFRYRRRQYETKNEDTTDAPAQPENKEDLL